MIEENPIGLLADFAKTVLDEPSPELFLSHLATKTLRSLDCRGVILGIIQREGFLDLRGAYGYDQKMVEPFMRIPLWTSMPITDAARTGEINIFQSSKAMIDAYPSLAEFITPVDMVTVSAPIIHRNVTLGAIGFTSVRAPQPDFAKSPITETILALTGLYIRNLLANTEANSRANESSISSLTPRQRKIIALFQENLTTDQMADRLRYSSSTIKQDIIKIYSIFGVNTRPAVLELAARAGLLDDDHILSEELNQLGQTRRTRSNS